MNLNRREIQDFIDRHLKSKAADLMLQASKYPEWDMKSVVQQLLGKQLAQKKLPNWFQNKNVLYPARLSMEQCSSEATAKYKSSIIHSGKGIDLTGGFGVDAYYLAQKSDILIYCEQNADLAKMVTHNFKALGQDNCSVYIGDGIHHLKELEPLDWIYIDPARRKETQRVFRLQDCEPNIMDCEALFFEKARKILIKTAPLLDINQTLKDLACVKEVHVVALNNECKEVLYLIEKGYNAEADIHCIHLSKENHKRFSFKISEEQDASIEYSKPLKYIYEAHSAIMKGGAFKSVAERYQLKKLHQHTHLYTSDKKVSDFPGRSFICEGEIGPNRKDLLKLGVYKANLACRNFPQKVEVLKKKLKLKDGGENYIFATTLIDGKPKLLLCKKVPQ